MSNSTKQTNPIDPSFIKELGGTLKWADDITAKLFSGAKSLEQEKEFIKLLGDYHKALKGETTDIDIKLQLKNLSLKNESIRDLIPIYLIISGIPEMLKSYANKNIPEALAYNTLNDIQIWIKNHQRNHATIGLKEIGWVTGHLKLKTFQIGLFQYEPRQFNKPIHLYLNKNTNKLIALAQDNLVCDEEGLLLPDDNLDKKYFSTIFREDAVFITANPVSPKGYILQIPFQINKDEWKKIASPGDNQIAFHIPEGSKLSLENINESLMSALNFFQTYYPEFSFNIIDTASWIFDDQIAQYLPESNIAKFQNCLQLLPLKGGNDDQFKERVFGNANIDITQTDPQSTLQKIGKKHVLMGKKWRKKSFVLYKKHIPLSETNLHLSAKENQ